MTKTVPMRSQQFGWSVRAMTASVLMVAAAAAIRPAHAQDAGRSHGHATVGPGAVVLILSDQQMHERGHPNHRDQSERDAPPAKP